MLRYRQTSGQSPETRRIGEIIGTISRADGVILLVAADRGSVLTNATHIYDSPPPGCAADWTMPQNWSAFSPSEHAVWDSLFERNASALRPFASRAFLDGLDVLQFDRQGVPKLEDINARLKKSTRFEVVAVPGWIPNEPFFRHLANRRFPAANFLRGPASLDYSEEPDMFHDLFGHVPTLTDPAFADFLVAYGEAGLRAETLGASHFLGRIWLYTVEFGLVCEDGALKAFGGGLLSSLAEARRAVTASDVRRLSLDVPRIMRTDYNFDSFQQVYFVIESFEHLMQVMEETDLAAVYREIANLPAIAADEAHPSDNPFGRNSLS